MSLTPDEFIPVRPRHAVPDFAEPKPAGWMETISGAVTVGNWPYRALRNSIDRFGAEYDPEHDPMSIIRGTKYETDISRFSTSYSEQETRAIMREWDQDAAARDSMSRSGWFGYVAALGSGLADPTVALPLVKVFSGVKAGYSALRLGGDVAISGALSSAISESALMATTPDMTAGEFARNVGTATVLSGLIGAGAGALLSRGDKANVLAKLESDRLRWGDENAAYVSGGTVPASGGAAASDTRALELDTPTLLSKLSDPTAKLSPPRRVLNSPFISARRAVVDLVETPYIFKENRAGIATTQGPALERLARLETSKARIAVLKQFDSAYAKYRFGKQAEGLGERFAQRLTRAADHVRSAEKATLPEFRAMVDDALRSGDVHEIPEVAETARFLRSRVIVPWRDRAIASKLLPEGVEVKTADSYMIRVWNKEKLIGERPRARQIISEWLQGQEDTKAGLQTQLKDEAELLSFYDQTIGAYEARAAGRETTLGSLSTRLDEMRRMNSFAWQRAGALREALTEQNETRSMGRAAEGATFETRIRGRGNSLADQVSGKQAALDAISAKLAKLISERDGLRERIEELIGAWQGRSALPAQAALKARAKKDAARAEKFQAAARRSVVFGVDGDASGLRIDFQAGDARSAAAQLAAPRQLVKDADGNIVGDELIMPRSTAADRDVDAAVARILSKARVTDPREVQSLADEIIDRIVGSPDGRLPYDIGSARDGATGAGMNREARGPLAARSFLIPDGLVREFLDTDALNTSEIFLNTIVPDVLLTERFGDIPMTDVFRRLHEEAAAQMHGAKDAKARLAIKANADAVEADLAAMRDRIRHTYGVSSDPRTRYMGRMAVTAARYDMATNLGGAALSSLPDLAGLQWRHGFTGAFSHAWKPFAKALVNPETRKALRAYRSQLQTMGIAAETWLNTRTSAIADVTDTYRPGSKFERGMKAVADKFGLASLLTPWTDFGKFAAGMVASGEYTRAIAASVAGKAGARQVRDLAEAGIDSAMASRIHAELMADGGADVIDGIRIPNTGNWTDLKARDAFEGAISRDADIMIMTPGAEKPLAMSNPVAALILQYKSFIAAANERILVRGLQARDAQAISGLVSAVGLGVLVEFAYSELVGRDMPSNPADLIKAGVNRSGLFGWYSEANAISAKLTGGAADAFRLIGATKPDSRFISRSKLGALLGPTANKLEAVLEIGSDLANLKWTAADTHRLRRLVIGQNLFYLRGIFDSLE